MLRFFQSWLVVLVLVCAPVPAFSVELIWDGGDDNWTDANWNGGKTPAEILGRSNGSQAVGDHIIIGGGASVVYDANVNGDFRVLQGSDMTIGDGASWNQVTLPSWSENRWTEMDLSNLTLNNGTFRRVGSGPGDGGGALIFGSWKGDDNFGEVPPPQVINILLTNGGRIENEGQMWFGAVDGHPSDLQVNMTIDDGSIDLTGGTIALDDLAADWAFFFAADENTGEAKNEQYSVNFIGPGSITVDRSGLVAPFQLDQGAGLEWVNLDAITFEDLWGLGILQANGQSDGQFSDFFTVEGDLGTDNYKLTSLVGGAGLDCDFNSDGSCDVADIDQLMNDAETAATSADMNGDGTVDMTDRDLWLSSAGDAGGFDGPLLVGDADLNGTVNASDLNALGTNWLDPEALSWSQGNFTTDGDSGVNAADLNGLGLNWQQTAGTAAAAAVPEPTGFALILSMMAGWGLVGRRRISKR